MSEIIQNVAVGLVVAVAIGYILRRAWHRLRNGGSPSCGGCSKCGAPPVLPVESLTAARKDPNR